MLRKLGTVWKCSSRVGLNLEVLRGFGTIWNCRVPGRLTCEKRAFLKCTRPGSCTSKLCPTREKRTLPNSAGLAEFGNAAWVGHKLEAPNSRGLGTIQTHLLLASWVQFGSATCGFGTIWKRSSRVGHNLEMPASRGLATSWKRSFLVNCAQFGRAARRLGAIWKFSRAAHDYIQRARFSRVGQNLQALRGLGTMWTRSSRAEHNLDVPASRGLGTIWK